MKKVLIGTVLALFAYGLRGQSLDRWVVGSAGAVEQQTAYALEWTVGEVAVSYHHSSLSELAEGFHQTAVSVLSFSSDSEQPLFRQVKVFPNPTAASVFIRAGLDADRQVRVLLFDGNGKLLPASFSTTGPVDREVDLGPYPPGVYRLIMRDLQGQNLYVRQIIKH